MAKDYEDLYDIENMSDDELKDLVLQQLSEYPQLDVDLIEVYVKNGGVRLAGRVGTEQEIQLAEQVITDTLGVTEFTNELVLDELVRGERSEAADEANADEADLALQAGGARARTSDEAAHLMENLDAEQFGTTDVQEAIERGTAYEAPEVPPQMGSERENH